MKIFCYLVSGFALAGITGCTTLVELVVSNEQATPISVHHADQSATIGPQQTATLTVPAVALPLRVFSDNGCAEFPLSLAGLPGKYYRPGIRHSVGILVAGPKEIRIEPRDEEDRDVMLVTATACEDAAEKSGN